MANLHPVYPAPLVTGKTRLFLGALLRSCARFLRTRCTRLNSFSLMVGS